MKAVLVMDMPERCMGCEFFFYLDEDAAYCEKVTDPDDNESFRTIKEDYCQCKPDWCPLKPMPEKMQVCGKYPQADRIVPSYKIGWNACIDKIMGGSE